MAHKKRYTAPLRRKRESKTNYRTRLVLLKSKLPRLVIRESNKHISLQVAEYGPKGDTIKEISHSLELKKYGWETSTGNIPSAYLTGLLLGIKAKGKEAILDIGLQAPIKGTRIFAALKGAADGGLRINFSKEAFPDEGRLKGKHIADFASIAKKEEGKFEKQFSGYIKKQKDPEKVQEYFEEAKQKIMSMMKNGR